VNEFVNPKVVLDTESKEEEEDAEKDETEEILSNNVPAEWVLEHVLA